MNEKPTIADMEAVLEKHRREKGLMKKPNADMPAVVPTAQAKAPEQIQASIPKAERKRLPSDVYEVLRPGETSHAPVYGNKEVASAGQSVSGQNGHKI